MKHNNRLAAVYFHTSKGTRVSAKNKLRKFEKWASKLVFVDRHAEFMFSMPQIYRRGLFGWL